jgi:hypothetical protein
MNKILAEQERRNRQSRDSWQLYASHRQQVTQLLSSLAATPNDRLCILGAGNCNDLDLAALTTAFREIHLVDWDTSALAAGVANQNLPANDRKKIQQIGGIDLTAIAEELACWSADAPPPDASIDQWIETCRSTNLPEPRGSFQVVASVCTLSQLIEAIILCLGEHHPRFMELVTAVRTRHLRSLVEFTAPDGTAVLITDIVSSVTFPPLPQIPLTQLAGTLSHLIQQQNFFTGTNPFVLEAFFRTDPQVAEQIAEVKLLPPWLWNFGPRYFAVCAITVRRHGTTNH